MIKSSSISGFFREKQVRQLIPIAHSTLWMWVREGKFPTPIKLSAKIVVWDARAVQEFIEQSLLKGDSL